MNHLQIIISDKPTNLVKYRQDRDLLNLRLRDLSLTESDVAVPQKKPRKIKSKPNVQERKDYAMALAQLAYDVFQDKKRHNGGKR